MGICEFFFFLLEVDCMKQRPPLSSSESHSMACAPHLGTRKRHWMTLCQPVAPEDWCSLPNTGHYSSSFKAWRKKKAPGAKDLKNPRVRILRERSFAARLFSLQNEVMVQEQGEVKAAAEEHFKPNVQSCIYNVDEFKFYFYRADFFSPLKLIVSGMAKLFLLLKIEVVSW